MKIIYTVIILAFILPQPLKAQLLDSIVPIICTHSDLPDSPSFILTASDYNYFLGLPASYVSSMQIIDAKNPWPPRWFATLPGGSGSKPPIVAAMPGNASFQQDSFIFFALVSSGLRDLRRPFHPAYILCNKQLEPVDTFSRKKGIDAHDFRLSPTGEKLYFEIQDTVLNAREIFGTDTFVKITYENIEISDINDSLVFCWNPLTFLGIKSLYLPYSDQARVITATRNTFEWSHGNSVCFDYDGNILYSYKHIGIGKISRNDGIIIWRIDRNNLKPNELSDTIPLYLQHDFKSVKDKNGNIIYTVISNGDSSHPQSEALRFAVKESANGKPAIKLLKEIIAPQNITQTILGNYDVEESGNYIVNYGMYKTDTANDHQFFEYRNKDDRLLAQYIIPPRGFCYRVHQLDNWIPPRPDVIEKNGLLLSSPEELTGTWYMLAGKDLKMVKEVGSGSKFKPLESGYYCLAVKYGIGYAVSEVIKYSK